MEEKWCGLLPRERDKTVVTDMHQLEESHQFHQILMFFMMISNPELWKRMSWVLKMSLLLPVHASLSCSVSCSETIAIPREIRHVT